MRVKRVISNNAVLATDENLQEVVALGRGLGHGRRPGDTLEGDQVEQVFFAADADERLAQFLADVPLDYVRAAGRIAELAHRRLGLRVTQSLLLPIADHLHFAVKRAREGLSFQFPLAWEVRQLYPAELGIGEEAVALANAAFAVELPEDEAVAFAMHLVNAQFVSPGMTPAIEMTQTIAGAFDVIERSFDVEIDHRSMSAARFVTHLRYLYARVASGKQIADPHPTFIDAITNAHPEAAACAAKLRYRFEMNLRTSLTDDEVAYLALHVARLLADLREREGLTKGASVTERREARTALIVASAGFFLITLDTLIINVALTQIEAGLGGGAIGQQWVIDGYTLFFAAFLLLAGNLTERWGAKPTYLVGMALFALTSLACGLAPSIGVLIAARCGQGLGAALMLPASMALIRERFPDSAERARALGVWAVGGAVAAAAGPLLGGILTTIDWRWVFHVNVPVCLGMAVLLLTVGPSPRRAAPFDWYGQVLSLLGLAALVYGLIEGGAVGFADPGVIATLAVAAVSFVAFVLVEGRRRHPMIPLGLFRPVAMRVALAAGFAYLVAWYGTVFVVSLYLQQHLGLAPLLAGLAFLPSALLSIPGNLVSGPLTNRFGVRVPMLLGFGLVLLGVTGIASTASLGLPWLTAAFVVPVGAGGSIAMPAATSLVLATVPADRAGTASAVFNTFRQVGGALAIAVFGALLAGPRGFVIGMQTSLAIAALVVLVTMLALRRGWVPAR